MYFDPSHPILLPLNHVPFAASLPRGWVRRPGTQSREGNWNAEKEGRQPNCQDLQNCLSSLLTQGGPGLLSLWRGLPTCHWGSDLRMICLCVCAGVEVAVATPNDLRGTLGLQHREAWKVERVDRSEPLEGECRLDSRLPAVPG